jgi:hypothetical protein
MAFNRRIMRLGKRRTIEFEAFQVTAGYSHLMGANFSGTDIGYKHKTSGG